MTRADAQLGDCALSSIDRSSGLRAGRVWWVSPAWWLGCWWVVCAWTLPPWGGMSEFGTKGVGDRWGRSRDRMIPMFCPWPSAASESFMPILDTLGRRARERAPTDSRRGRTDPYPTRPTPPRNTTPGPWGSGLGLPWGLWSGPAPGALADGGDAGRARRPHPSRAPTWTASLQLDRDSAVGPSGGAFGAVQVQPGGQVQPDGPSRHGPVDRTASSHAPRTPRQPPPRHPQTGRPGLRRLRRPAYCELLHLGVRQIGVHQEAKARTRVRRVAGPAAARRAWPRSLSVRRPP
ncbi:hypothetical protein SAMN04487766_10193 [Actinomyces ruminicola]|uniref:Uncharacterized protein n=1 Tax=Actinomyces ruminicola TaxID=332524 RepID=A0A1G9RQL2_9ACTO|nr:hypothetical protein SAMN04487766_10193 [Actinomyces ruminicola]